MISVSVIIRKTRKKLNGKKIGLPADDKGYRGKKEVNGTKIIIPDNPKKSDTVYEKRKKKRLFRKRAGIEPTIGHLKSDYRLNRKFYKGVTGGCYKHSIISSGI